MLLKIDKPLGDVTVNINVAVAEELAPRGTGSDGDWRADRHTERLGLGNMLTQDARFQSLRSELAKLLEDDVAEDDVAEDDVAEATQIAMR